MGTSTWQSEFGFDCIAVMDVNWSFFKPSGTPNTDENLIEPGYEMSGDGSAEGGVSLPNFSPGPEV